MDKPPSYDEAASMGPPTGVYPSTPGIVPPQGYAPPPQGYAPPPQGYAPPPQGYAPPPQGYAPHPQGLTQPVSYGQPQNFGQGQGAYQQPYGFQTYGPPTQQFGQPMGAQYPPTNRQQGVVAASTVVVVGAGCQACQNGQYVEDFTACGLLLAIFFFPWGLICCLLMREKRCPRCHRLVE